MEESKNRTHIIKLSIVAILLILVATAFAAPISAGAPPPVHNQDTSEDFWTIQAAIDAVNTSDGHTITVDPGTYTENVDVNKQLTIRSTSGNPADTIVQAASSDDHAFDVTKSYVNISGFNVTGATGTQKAGICLGTDVEHCNIFDNLASNNTFGIHLWEACYNTLTNNTAFDNDDSGIQLGQYSCNNTLTDNNACDNGGCGIGLWNNASYNTLSDNNASDNELGIELVGLSNHNTLLNNTASRNSVSDTGEEGKGIYVVDSSYNDIESGNIIYNDIGILIDAGMLTSYNNVTGVIVSDNELGIELMGEDNCAIADCIIRDNTEEGIYLEYSSDITLLNNSISGNNVGVYAEGLDYLITIEDCEINDNYEGGIACFVDEYLETTIVNNNISNNNCSEDSEGTGGGIRLHGTDNTVSVINATISGNNITQQEKGTGGHVRVGYHWEYATAKTSYVTLIDNYMAGGRSGSIKLHASEYLEVNAANNQFINITGCCNKIGHTWDDAVKDLNVTLIGNVFSHAPDSGGYGLLKILADENITALVTGNTFEGSPNGGTLRIGWVCGGGPLTTQNVTATIADNTFEDNSGGAILTQAENNLDVEIYDNNIDGTACDGERSAVEVVSDNLIHAGIYSNTITDFSNSGIYVSGARVLRHSGSCAWYSSDKSSYQNTTLTRTVDLTGVTHANLTFWHWYHTMPWCGGRVEVNNGSGWIPIDPEGGYPGSGYWYDGYLGQSAGWEQASFDLMEYAGQSIELRFRYTVYYSAKYVGWYVDDISISEIGFFDDVESGVGDWVASSAYGSKWSLCCADVGHEDIFIYGNDISLGDTGIYLACNDGVIENNTIYDNDEDGICLEYSNNNTFTGNTVSNNTGWDFYTNEYSHNNTVEDLTLSSYPTTVSFTFDNGILMKGVETAPGDPADWLNISKFVNATNATANSWLFLNVSYEESDLGSVTEDSLRLWEHNGTDWSEVTGTNGVNTMENCVFANITEFSIFAPLGCVTAPDTTPPASVSDLNETDTGKTWIQWNWTNPSDADFNHTEVWVDGERKENVTMPEHTYNATGLSLDMTYEIGTRTVDSTGNVNQTWINDTAKTLKSTEEDTTPPVIESVTLDAYTTVPDATIQVTVVATDNVGVTAVTADGTDLVDTGGSTWEGSIAAPSATGDYTVTIRAEDAADNFNETTVAYSVVKPSGSIGIGVDPRLTSLSAGSTVSINIKLVSVENFDDIAYVYLTTDGLPPIYQANLTWFNWTSQSVKVPAGAVVNVPLEVSIPTGESGYKVFYAKLESTKWTPTAMDTGILYIT